MDAKRSNQPADGREVARFVALLREGRGTRVDSRRLWQALAAVYPHRPSGPTERELFLAVLHAAAEAGALRLPSAAGRRWDRSLSPPVPRSVDLLQEQSRPDPADWRTYPWHESLAWVAGLPRLTERQVWFLKRVHEGLVNRSFQDVAPLKYRSLQLTGDEKGLAEMLSSSLFGPGRLSAETLNCVPDVLPLAWEPVGQGGRAVIFENAGPFAVARRVLADMPERRRPYGLVVYGGGRAILASLGHLTTIERRVESLHYVGDLDAAGLEIATAARREARRLQLPELRPAEELLRAMFRSAAFLGHSEGWPAHEPRSGDRRRNSVRDEQQAQPDTTEEYADWLSSELQQQVLALLRKGMRIPEEVLGPAEMRRAWQGGS